MKAKLCEICGDPMPDGETMFKYHGYSGPCPKPPLKKPTPAPAWHDAPEVATLKAERDELKKDAERYRWLAAYARSTSEHWGGRWSIVIDGPAPKNRDSEDDFNEAIDAAIAKAGGGAS